MKEFKRSDVVLNIYGSEIKVSLPTFGQAKKLRERAKQDGNDLVMVQEVLVECGISAEVLESMEAQHVGELIEFMVSPKKS